MRELNASINKGGGLSYPHIHNELLQAPGLSVLGFELYDGKFLVGAESKWKKTYLSFMEKALLPKDRRWNGVQI